MSDPTPPNERAAIRLSTPARIVLAGIAVLATLFLLLAADLAARLYLGATGAPQYNLVWQPAPKAAKRETVYDRRLSQGLTVLDPQMGYGRPPGGDPATDPAWRWPGFRTSGTEADGALRVAVLGGSTSDPFYEPEWGVWSEALYQRLASGSGPAVVYNGAVSGYSTNQELLKLTRDVRALSPDWVISLSGVNDLSFAHSLRDHPMVSPYQLVMMQTLANKGHIPTQFMPNLVAALRSNTGDGSNLTVSTGMPYNISDADMWRQNIELMNLISQQMGARFHVFLQPAMGVDAAYTKTDAELALYDSLLQSRPDYPDQAAAFYAAARRHCAALDYCTDISEIFAGKTGLYHDPRHPNHEGNALIGAKVYETLFAAEAPRQD